MFRMSGVKRSFEESGGQLTDQSDESTDVAVKRLKCESPNELVLIMWIDENQVWCPCFSLFDAAKLPEIINNQTRFNQQEATTAMADALYTVDFHTHMLFIPHKTTIRFCWTTEELDFTELKYSKPLPYSVDKVDEVKQTISSMAAFGMCNPETERVSFMYARGPLRRHIDRDIRAYLAPKTNSLRTQDDDTKVEENKTKKIIHPLMQDMLDHDPWYRLTDLFEISTQDKIPTELQANCLIIFDFFHPVTDD